MTEEQQKAIEEAEFLKQREAALFAMDEQRLRVSKPQIIDAGNGWAYRSIESHDSKPQKKFDFRVLPKRQLKLKATELKPGEEMGRGSAVRECQIVDAGPDWVLYDNGWKYRTSDLPDGNRQMEERILEEPNNAA